MEQGHAQAFERLDALLARLHPRHAATRRPLPPDTGAPARMSALWEAIGCTEATAFLRPLGREQGRRALADAFEDWFADVKLRDHWGVSPGEDGAAWARLPARYHVAWISSSAGIPSEIVLTDESTSADDPPVMVLRRDGSPLSLWHTSYVEWAIWTLLRRVTAFRATRFDPRCGLAGPAVLAPVYPRLEELAVDVWRMREPGLARADVLPATPDILFYSSLARYLEFTRSLSDEALAYLSPPTSAQLLVDAPGVDLQSPGCRVFEPEGVMGGLVRRRNAVGRLDGIAVWLQAAGGSEVLIRYDPRHDAQLRRWLDDRGVPIRSEQPMPDGYEALGW